MIVSASGGIGPYTGTGTFSQSAGTTVYTVTDASGCRIDPLTLTEPAPLVITVTPGTINCFGGTTSVVVTASGGAPTYCGPGYYGVGTFTRPAGTYTFTVSDWYGCTASATVTIAPAVSLVASCVATDAVCFGGDGSVTVSATGGTSPYSGDGTFSVPAGTYNYTVTDANGCTASQRDGEPACRTAGYDLRPLFLLPGTDCDGGYDAAADPLLWRFSADHRFSDWWHRTLHGSRYLQPVGRHYGIHRYRRQRLRSFHICITFTTRCSALSYCHGRYYHLCWRHDERNRVGNRWYSVFNCWGYSCSGTGTILRPAGTHSFTVTDWHGCTASASVTITQPDPIVVNCTVTEPTCYGENGTVLVEATGTVGATTGTGTFSVPAGEYYIFNVTDANGCISGCTGQISQPAKVEALSTSSTPSDCGGATGTATVVATGGTGSYTYLWSPGGQTSATATGLTAGMYTVQITDGSGCSGTASIEVTGTGTSPAAAGPVIGPSGACRNSTIVFSIDPVANASEYQWMLPGGAGGTSTSNTISVSFGPSLCRRFHLCHSDQPMRHWSIFVHQRSAPGGTACTTGVQHCTGDCLRRYDSRILGDSGDRSDQL